MLVEEHAAFASLYRGTGKFKMKSWRLQEPLQCKNTDDEQTMTPDANKNIVAY